MVQEGTMTPEKRQALLEKHRRAYHPIGYSKCRECSVPWPCDVIQVLDELDQIAFWVDYRNGLDVHGAIGRIQNLLDGIE
jgi:hypothetical protein